MSNTLVYCSLTPGGRTLLSALFTISKAWSTADTTPDVFNVGALLTIKAKYTAVDDDSLHVDSAHDADKAIKILATTGMAGRVKSIDSLLE